jgi:fucose permease
MPRFLGSAIVLVTGLLLFFQSGIEFTLGGFISTYLTRGQALSIQDASWILAAYWAAIIVARVLSSRLLLNADPHRVVLFSALVACVAAVITSASTGVLAASAIVITGLALSPIYPTVLGIAGARFKEHSGTVFGILFTIALCGGMLVPWISGQLAQQTSLRAVFAVVAVAFAMVAILRKVVERLGAARA